MHPRSKKAPSPITTKVQPLRRSIGNSPKSAHEEEKVSQLLKIFEEIDTNHDKELTLDEIRAFLSTKQSEQFDEILCEELFARLDKDRNSKVSIEEFVSNYVEVEGLIISQIRSLAKQVKKTEEKVRENQEKLRREKKNEVMKSNGIMQGSCLTITVKSAVDLVPTTADGLCNAFVQIDCDGNSYSTHIVPSSLKPSWDERFEIPIAKKETVLSLTVLSKSALGTKFVGKASVIVMSLYDQNQKEQYYSLLSEKGEAWQGKILLEHQWIWSMVKFYEDIIKQQEKFVAEDKEKIENLKIQREKLMKPFISVTEDEPEYIYDPSQSGISGVSVSENQTINQPKSPTTFIDDWAEKREVIVFLIYFYMILAVLNNFTRCEFVNVTCSAVGYYNMRYQDAQGMRDFLTLLALSEAYDLVWVVVFGKALLTIETFGVFICLFLIGYKGVLFMIVGKRFGFIYG